MRRAARLGWGQRFVGIGGSDDLRLKADEALAQLLELLADLAGNFERADASFQNF
jgi:hypothetical protein